MARIAIVTPARPGARTGNLHTAQRWAAMLRAGGHRVSVASDWAGESCDLLLALHAKRSHASVLRYRAAHPAGPLIVTLTGTDLYRDLPSSREGRESLALADRVIVLQENGKKFLEKKIRRKARTVYQSADPRVRHSPPLQGFRIAVIGHLRDVKDPFRAARALSHLKHSDIELVQIGGALEPEMRSEARDWMKREPRYRWLGSMPHARALDWIARSHLMVISSLMEGGANVISEAARIGTPVLASRMSGNIGMLGRAYPGYFPLFDDLALSRLLKKSFEEQKFYSRLKRALAARRGLFAPSAERRSLLGVVRETLSRQSSVRR